MKLSSSDKTSQQVQYFFIFWMLKKKTDGEKICSQLHDLKTFDDSAIGF